MRTNDLFLFILIISFCSSCERNYGYILDINDKKPMSNVIVIDLNDATNFTLTDKKGKFIFDNCGDLLIKKVGFSTDTLEKYGCRPNMNCFNGHIFYMEKRKVK